MPVTARRRAAALLPALILCLLLVPFSGWAAAPASDQELLQLFERLVKHTTDVVEPSLHVGDGPEFDAGPAYSTLAPVCRVHVSADFARRASRDAVAGVIAHELAHCSLGRTRFMHEIGQLRATVTQWNEEYDADQLGIAIATRAGIPVLHDYALLLLGTRASGSHPPGPARVLAMAGGARQYNTVARRAPGAARALQVAANGQWEIR